MAPHHMSLGIMVKAEQVVGRTVELILIIRAVNPGVTSYRYRES